MLLWSFSSSLSPSNPLLRPTLTLVLLLLELVMLVPSSPISISARLTPMLSSPSPAFGSGESAQGEENHRGNDNDDVLLQL